VLDADSLRLIADLCSDHDLYALSDEIYEKLVYGKEHISLASLPGMAERTITVNGFSKAYAMTGWRIGYAVAPRPIIRQMEKVQQHTVSHPTTFAMYGALAALRGSQDCVETMRQEFDRRRRYVASRLASIPGLSCPEMEGAFYAFVNISQHLGKTYGGVRVDDDTQWCLELLGQKGVASVMGSAFGAPGCVRFSFATSLENLAAAMDAVQEFVKQHDDASRPCPGPAPAFRP